MLELSAALNRAGAGSLLTTATLDLAAGEVISGSSRLVAGTMQLVLLSFGLVVGAEIVLRFARR